VGEEDARNVRRPLALGLAGALLAAGAVPFALGVDGDLVSGLAIVLAVSAALSSISAAPIHGRVALSANFVCLLLAVIFLAPPAAFAVMVVAELMAWLAERYRPAALLVNLAAQATPAYAAAALLHALTAGVPMSSPWFVAAVLAVAVLLVPVNFFLVSVLGALHDGTSLRAAVRFPREMLPTHALTIAATLLIADLYARLGLVAFALVLLALVVFTYMARLVITARERTRQYASLSWGVLGGLLRTLHVRDGRAARHSAAVAAFARDIARQAGLTPAEQELAHTAGLLHDIGRFALADRVLERGGELLEEDWRAIQRHPELGADLLRDLGVYGPVAQIVRAHHERIDGRGYPDGLQGDQIPAIARIVAVAEVYDTLTAQDTYRTPMTSFEALTELRRVAGSQLDDRYVEALAALLAGQGTSYRHADAADFDVELAMERRIAAAVGPADAPRAV
jgi:putative nucleotidyltransferase with HDIG domain